MDGLGDNDHEAAKIDRPSSPMQVMIKGLDMTWLLTHWEDGR